MRSHFGHRSWTFALLATSLLYGCTGLPGRLRTDPPGTALNASSSRWIASSSSGAYGEVRQVATGLNRFSFKETWNHGKASEPIETSGKGSYEPSNQINIYEYSQPAGVVVVRTKEGKDAGTTEDTVLATTIPLFKVGETITYTLKP